MASAAIAACTSAILVASELTHCRPDDCATWLKSCIGKSYDCTLGRAVLAGAVASAGLAAGACAVTATGAGAA